VSVADAAEAGDIDEGIEEGPADIAQPPVRIIVEEYGGAVPSDRIQSDRNGWTVKRQGHRCHDQMVADIGLELPREASRERLRSAGFVDHNLAGRIESIDQCCVGGKRQQQGQQAKLRCRMASPTKLNMTSCRPGSVPAMFAAGVLVIRPEWRQDSMARAVARSRPTQRYVMRGGAQPPPRIDGRPHRAQSSRGGVARSWPLRPDGAELKLNREGDRVVARMARSRSVSRRGGDRRQASSKMATARVHPAEAPRILCGKQLIVKPWPGRASRLCSFSKWQ
jgi:hypothetical protein